MISANLSIVACMARNRVIGLAGDMPWHLPADLQHFKKITLGKPVIMGRATFESIGKPLPGRTNIIVTKNQNYKAVDCQVAHSLQEAISYCTNAPEIMVIGGGTIYQQTLPQAQRLYLTLIDQEIAGDTYFPAWQNETWRETSSVAHEDNGLSFRFVTLERTP